MRSMKKAYVSPFDWQEGKNGTRHATMVVNDFTVELKIEMDYDHEFDFMRGQFSSKRLDGAVRNPRARYDHSLCEWFIPDYSLEERREDYKARGYAKHEAYLRARTDLMRDLHIAADPEGAGAMAAKVTVTVSYKDIELASETAWGLEVDDFENEYIDNEAIEKLEEATATAVKKLEELRKG